MSGKARRYGPKQLRDALGLEEWQFSRAYTKGDVPAPDLEGGKWSAAVVEVLAGKAATIRRRAGNVPDCGALAAAEVLAKALGIDVSADAVAELARRRRLDVVGDYKGHPLYDGRQLERFKDRTAVEAAEVDGEQLTTERVTDRLGVRATDTAWLVKLGWLRPVAWYEGQWASRVPVYRAGDVTELLQDPGINWDAVRAVKSGGRSVLAGLPERPGRAGRR